VGPSAKHSHHLESSAKAPADYLTQLGLIAVLLAGRVRRYECPFFRSVREGMISQCDGSVTRARSENKKRPAISCKPLFYMVPGAGLEPARRLSRGILSPMPSIFGNS